MSLDIVPPEDRIPKSHFDRIPDDFLTRNDPPEKELFLDKNTFDAIRTGKVLPTPETILDYPDAFRAFLQRVRSADDETKASCRMAVIRFDAELQNTMLKLGAETIKDLTDKTMQGALYTTLGSVVVGALGARVLGSSAFSIIALILGTFAVLLTLKDVGHEANALAGRYTAMRVALLDALE
jgi:hypothetical protein